jgi:hypothetical protein
MAKQRLKREQAASPATLYPVPDPVLFANRAVAQNPVIPSRFVPRPTIIEPASGNGCCRAFAASHSARIQQSCSCVVRITGIAFGYSHGTTIEAYAT